MQCNAILLNFSSSTPSTTAPFTTTIHVPATAAMTPRIITKKTICKAMQYYSISVPQRLHHGSIDYHRTGTGYNGDDSAYYIYEDYMQRNAILLNFSSSTPSTTAPFTTTIHVPATAAMTPRIITKKTICKAMQYYSISVPQRPPPRLR